MEEIIMKTIAKASAVIMALAILLSLAACGGAKEEAADTANASPLVGTWSNSEYGTAYTFNADGSGVLTGDVTGSGYTMEFTYEDKGTYVDIDYNVATKVQSIDYSISGDTLTLAGIEYKK